MLSGHDSIQQNQLEMIFKRGSEFFNSEPRLPTN